MAWEIDTASASASLRMLRLSAGRPSDRAMEVVSTEVDLDLGECARA